MDSRLQALIAEILDVPPSQIAADMRRRETETWDSMNHLRLITAVETAFAVRLTMDQIAHIESPRQLEQILRSRGALHD